MRRLRRCHTAARIPYWAPLRPWRGAAVAVVFGLSVGCSSAPKKAKWSDARPAGSAELQVGVSSADLVRQKLRDHKILRNRDIVVSRRGAAVQLEGTVNSSLERTMAYDWARSTPTVETIENHLDTTGSAPDSDDSVLTDSEVRGAVQRVMNLTKGFDPRNITISVSKRVVALQGRIATSNDAAEIESVIRNVVGVRKVVNKLSVSEG